MTGCRHQDYLGHMLEAFKLARSYVAGMNKAQFLADRKTQQAVILNILVLGEAATKMGKESPDWVAAHPALPWAAMRGMRNRLAHGYFEINLDIVWETLQQSLEPLENELTALLTEGA